MGCMLWTKQLKAPTIPTAGKSCCFEIEKVSHFDFLIGDLSLRVNRGMNVGTVYQVIQSSNENGDALSSYCLKKKAF